MAKTLVRTPKQAAFKPPTNTRDRVQTKETHKLHIAAWRVYYLKAHLSRIGTDLLCSNVLIGLIVWGFGAA